MVRVEEELPFLLLLLLLLDVNSAHVSISDCSGVGRLGHLARPEEEVPRGSWSQPQHPAPPPTTPLGLYDAPGVTPAGADDRGDPGGKLKVETSREVPQKNDSDGFPEGVATAKVVASRRSSRRRRKARRLVPPFEALPGPLGDLGGERPHGEGMGKGLDDLFPLPYPPRWSQTEERRSWTEWGRAPHRRHRLRHEKGRREKEKGELLLLGSLLQEERRAPDGGHPASRPEREPSLLEQPATEHDLLLLLLRHEPPSNFKSGADDGGEKQEGSSSRTRTTPSLPDEDASTSQTTKPEGPLLLLPPGARQGESQGVGSSLASFLTPTTALIDEEWALRTLRDQDRGHRTFLNASLRPGGQEEEEVVVEAAGDTTFNHPTNAEGDHPTTSVATLPESSSPSGSPPPDVTGKPQDPARDPLDAYEPEAITPGDEEEEEPHTPRRSLQPTRKNPESTMSTVRGTDVGETLEYISKSLPTTTSLSARQTGDRDAEEAPARPGGDADGVEVEGPRASTLQPLPDVSGGAPASDPRPERDGGSAGPPEPPAVETGGPVPPAEGDAAAETELRDTTVEITPTPEQSGDPIAPRRVENTFLSAPLTTSSGLNTAPSHDYPAVPSCYTSYDLVAVVLLTSLANLVTFVVVTLLLCWCSLRARGGLPAPQPRPLHLDDQNNEDPDDEAEETVVPEGCLEACLPDISYQRHIARGSTLRPSFVVGRRPLRPLGIHNAPRISQAVQDLLHNLTASSTPQLPQGQRQHRRGGKQQENLKEACLKQRRSLSLENLSLT